jgi:predicted NodU family carbamoyl transferase
LPPSSAQPRKTPVPVPLDGLARHDDLRVHPGYKKYGDEGKVMGLVPLGKDTYREHFDDRLRLTDKGFDLNLDYFMPFGKHQGMSITEKGEMQIHRHYSDQMLELFGDPCEPYSDYAERDMDLAFGVQRALQTVSRDENPLYYDLIRAFEAKTGIPVLLNTSFNENEPIVCEPAEAIDCHLRTKMDVLAIGPFVCKKTDG